VLGALFGTGHLLLGRLPVAVLCSVVAATGSAGVIWSLRRFRKRGFSAES
jgi:hypothetical protein